MRRIVAILSGILSGAGLALVLAAAPAAAQSLRLATSDAPHYQGAPIDIQITADGFQEEPAPSIEAGRVSRGTLAYRGVQPSVSSSIVIVGGQVRRSQEVKFVFNYRLRVTAPGPVTVEPFVVSQGAMRLETQRLRLDVRAVPTNEQISVALEFPDGPVYVGERVPVAVRFRLQGSVRENLHRYSLRVPLFDQTESFRFLDVPDPGETDIEVETEKGVLSLKGEAHTSGGDGGLIVTLRRIAVPLRAGEVEIPATQLDVEEGVRFRRDLFGGRQPTRVRKWRAADQPRRFVVSEIPAADTPPSFAGAVGTGFALEVRADRTVVQVGEPIVLSFELRGDGNLETASLPRLDAEGLLPPSQFHVPDGEIAGRVEQGTKRFTASVRVVDPNVSEIPALEYAWFDPERKRFQTAQSRPIALSVRDAEMIGAAQVERDATPGGSSPGAGSGGGATAPRGPTGSLVLSGADLAIERDPRLLSRAASGRAANPLLLAGLYGAGVLAIAVAYVDRRRRDVDPALVARRKSVDVQLRRLRDAGSLPADRAAGEIARALRQLLAELPDSHRALVHAEVDALLGECDARSYAPAGVRDEAAQDMEIHHRAVELAERMVAGVA